MTRAPRTPLRQVSLVNDDDYYDTHDGIPQGYMATLIAEGLPSAIQTTPASFHVKNLNGMISSRKPGVNELVRLFTAKENGDSATEASEVSGADPKSSEKKSENIRATQQAESERIVADVALRTSCSGILTDIAKKHPLVEALPEEMSSKIEEVKWVLDSIAGYGEHLSPKRLIAPSDPDWKSKVGNANWSDFERVSAQETAAMRNTLVAKSKGCLQTFRDWETSKTRNPSDVQCCSESEAGPSINDVTAATSREIWCDVAKQAMEMYDLPGLAQRSMNEWLGAQMEQADGAASVGGETVDDMRNIVEEEKMEKMDKGNGETEDQSVDSVE